MNHLKNKCTLLVALASSFLFINCPNAFAQNDDLKKSWGDLKKAFKPEKAFIYPVADTNDPDLQAFAFAISEIEGVNKVSLAHNGHTSLVKIDAKISIITIMMKWPKEIENRYELGERTDKGYILNDRMNTNATNKLKAISTKPETKPSGKNGTPNAKKLAEADKQ